MDRHLLETVLIALASMAGVLVLFLINDVYSELDSINDKLHMISDTKEEHSAHIETLYGVLKASRREFINRLETFDNRLIKISDRTVDLAYRKCPDSQNLSSTLTEQPALEE